MKKILLVDDHEVVRRGVADLLGAHEDLEVLGYWEWLDGLRQWADAVLRQHYDGYELRDCWPRHIHAIWELSTLAAEWHRTYNRKNPDLDRALEFHDRWLPGAMRRVADITRRCNPECITRQRTPAYSRHPNQQEGPRQ